MKLLTVGCAALLLAGLSCSAPPKASGPARADGTVPFDVAVRSDEPGAQIQVNGDTIAKTPAVITIYGDRDGSFHNYGSFEFIIKVYPPDSARRPLTKTYKTGAMMAEEDKIPESIHFDFAAGTVTSTERKP